MTQRQPKFAANTGKDPEISISILQEAHNIINGQRQEDYGNKLENFSQIAMGFQMVLAKKLQATAFITPEDVALLMMQVKIARAAKSPSHRDSILDIAGYAGCYDLLRKEREAMVELPGAIFDSNQDDIQS